ncbi:hypothetical protein SHKM778_41710 [Streptomyces sp. KM77-8]|uniref:HemN C-terminal domain-containing protein n=1 Tax=Streptomyces haneummycinicus TaxID=3074435 RepID=A0AAT9HKX1_9ACTN
MFRRADAPPQGADDYACQTDGMIGLGCGARSYTAGLHYSFDYAVGMHEIRGIIDDYVSRPAADFAHAEYGRRVDAGEARRRHLLQSLLQADGLDVADYRARFDGRAPADDFPAELTRFADRGWLTGDAGLLRLTPRGWRTPTPSARSCSPRPCGPPWPPTSGSETRPMDLTLLYRGPLASCDYDCPYCPFAKRRDSREQLRADRACLERFADWAEAQTADRLSLLFTPGARAWSAPGTATP